MEIITENDLDDIITTQRPEDRTIEYKSQINLGDNEKYDLCRDVAAFANTEGGHIIYGIEEMDGKANKCVGVINNNSDNLCRRVESILDSNIEPKIYDKRIYQVKNCLVITIKKSWNSPHAVKLGGSKYQFVYRKNSGNDYLDLATVKENFMQFNKLIQDIESFIERQNDKLMNGNDKPTVVMHVVPLPSFSEKQSIDIDRIDRDVKCIYDHLLPLAGSTDAQPEYLPNIDGLKVWLPNSKKNKTLQLFRSSAIETSYLTDKEISPESFKEYIKEGLKRYLNFYDDREIKGPYYIFISILNSQGCSLKTSDGEEEKWYEDKKMNLGSIEIESYTDSELDPLFKIFYNAFGKFHK